MISIKGQSITFKNDSYTLKKENILFLQLRPLTSMLNQCRLLVRLGSKIGINQKGQHIFQERGNMSFLPTVHALILDWCMMTD